MPGASADTMWISTQQLICRRVITGPATQAVAISKMFSPQIYLGTEGTDIACYAKRRDDSAGRAGPQGDFDYELEGGR